MHLLTRQDFATIQAFVDYCIALFDRYGLAFGVSGDMGAFAAFIAGEEHSWGASASHSPEHSYLTPGNAFWTYLAEKDTGRKVATSTNKVIQTESFVADIYSHALFDSLKPVVNCRLPELQDGVEEDEFRFAGKVAYASGMYVHPDYRSKGLVILGPLCRTLAIRHYQADWVVGIHRLTAKSDWHARNKQYFAHCRPFLKGMPYKWDGDFQIAWSTRSEWLEGIQRVLRDAGRNKQETSRSQPDSTRAEAIANSRA